MKRILLFSALLVMGTLCLAQSGRGPEEKKVKNDKAAKPAAQATAPQMEPAPAAEKMAAYRVGPGDQLHINVWNEAAVSSPVVVRPDCRISLPLVKEMEVCGMTPLEIQSSLSTQFAKFITAPDVTVVVSQIVSRKIYLHGEVRRPGPMPLLGPMTIAQALSEAGGITEYASGKNILILRTEDGKQVRFTFNYKAFLKGEDKGNIPLKPGDTIVVK